MVLNNKIFIFIGILLSYTSADDDYCFLESCGTKSHIACDKNSHKDLDNNLFEKQENVVMPEEIKERLLDIYNRYKNDIARNHYPGRVLSIPTAANLSVIVWSDELERLANMASEKLHAEDMGFEYCYNTPHLHSTLFKTTLYSNFDLDDIFTKLDHTFNNPDARNSFGKWSINFFAVISQIGCRFVYYENTESTSNLAIRCIYGFNRDWTTMKIIDTPYAEGIPCSLCPSECDVNYSSLCAAF